MHVVDRTNDDELAVAHVESPSLAAFEVVGRHLEMHHVDDLTGRNAGRRCHCPREEQDAADHQRRVTLPGLWRQVLSCQRELRVVIFTTMASDHQPLSLRLDKTTLRRATAFAKKRQVGVTTALRMLINEQLDAVDEEAELGAALRWQQKETMATLDRWEAGETAEMTVEQLRDTHRKALKRATGK